MADIELKNIVQGGLAFSPYMGGENSVQEMVGLDIHSEPGVIKVNQQLAKESGATVDDFVKAIINCSDGNTYLFGSTTGKIWKRDSSGNYTLEATASPSSGDAGIKDAEEYDGYIYYAMQDYLGRVNVPSSGDIDWSTRSDSWGAFTNGDPDFHPMKKANLVLYIGDGNLVAQVNDGTFTQNALDIVSPLRVRALGQFSTDLLIGTYVNDNIMETQILRWNTWSPSFSVSDTIPEVGVNAFLESDNNTIVNAGKKGRFYFYNGKKLEPARRIPGVFPIGTTDKVIVHQNAVHNYAGLPLFGLSQQTGNGALYGIYSLGRHSESFSTVLNLEFVGSPDKTEDMEYGAILGVGDIFLVSWKNASDGSVGVDKLDLNNKYTGAYFKTRVMQGQSIERTGGMEWSFAQVGYRSLPADTDIKFYKNVNHAGFGSEISSTTHDKDLIKETDVDLGHGNTMEVKIELTANGNDAPEIENFVAKIHDIEVGEK